MEIVSKKMPIHALSTCMSEGSNFFNCNGNNCNHCNGGK